MKPLAFPLASSLSVAVALLVACSQGGPPLEGATGSSSTLGEAHENLTPGEVLPTGGVCAPTGAHGKGAGMNGHVERPCQTCHACGGVLQFDANGVAATTVFDATSKGCAGGCHTDGNGGAPAVKPSWYGAFPTTTCTPDGRNCGTCNTGAVCCNCHMADNTNSYLTMQTGAHRIHVGQHFPCVTCHADPSTSTHVNGVKDVKSVITLGSGANIETIHVYRPAASAPAPYGGVCKGAATCLGACHGHDHHPTYAWNAGCW